MRWWIAVGILLSCATTSEAMASRSKEKELIRSLMKNYERVGRLGRPVNDSDDSILVHYGISLVQILDLDERNQVLTVNVWGNYKWVDVLLVWDPADYNNITSVMIPSHLIWLPDIKLYNYADVRLSELRESLVVVYHTGWTLWVPQAVYKSSCAIDITHFPFDEQTCTMKFGSWSYDGAKVDVAFFFPNNTGFDFSDYIPSNEWDIIEYSSKRYVKKYQCCPEIYPDLKFTLRMKRKVVFYNYILILPCVLLSSLTLVLFWLPPESPAKMQLGMNIFVAFFVLLLLLAESTPPAASSIPLIGAYYCLNMILITLSTFLSVIVVNLYFHGNRSLVPRILKRVMMDWVARLLCMRDYVLDFHSDHAKAEQETKKRANHACQNGGKRVGKDRYHDIPHMNGIVPAKLSRHYGEQTSSLNVDWPIRYPEEPPPPPPNAHWLYHNSVAAYTKPTLKNSNENLQYTSKFLYRNDRLSYSNDGLAYDKVPSRYNLPTLESHNLVSRESIVGSDAGDDRLNAATAILDRMDGDIADIKAHVKSMAERITGKEQNDKIGREWKGVAIVLDRIFFFIYLASILVSIFTIFPKSAILEWTKS